MNEKLAARDFEKRLRLRVKNLLAHTIQNVGPIRLANQEFDASMRNVRMGWFRTKNNITATV